VAVVGISEGFSHQYPHTLFVGYNNEWTSSQRNATGLLFCFGHAVALAKRLYGVIDFHHFRIYFYHVETLLVI